MATKPVLCAKCENKGWFSDGSRRFRCVLCNNKPSVKLGPEKSDSPDLPSDPPRPRSVREPVLCKADGCRAKTSNNKPYCSRHIFLLPYPRQVRDHVALVAREVKQAGYKTPNLPAKGLKTAEIAVVLLRKGPRTPGRLAIDVDLVVPGLGKPRNRTGQRRLLAFASAMREAMLVRLIEVRSPYGGRGETRLMVDLTPAGRRFAEESIQNDLALETEFLLNPEDQQEVSP